MNTILNLLQSLSLTELIFFIILMGFFISIVFGAARRFWMKLLLGIPGKTYHPTSFYKKQKQNLDDIWNNRGYKDFGIERLLRLTLQLLAFITPAGIIRWVTGRRNLLFRKIGIEAYAIGKVIFAWQAIIHGWTSNGWVTVVIIIFTADTLHFLISRIVLNDVWRQPISFQRSLIMTLVNYVEVCLCFAAVYFYCDHAYPAVFEINKDIALENGHLPAAAYIYFSFVTAATIGYGDISPLDPFIQKIVNAQIIVSLFMVVVIIANVASKLHEDTFYNEKQKKKDEQKK